MSAPTFEQKQVGRALLLLREAARLREGGHVRAVELEADARSLLGAALHNWGFEAEDFEGEGGWRA